MKRFATLAVLLLTAAQAFAGSSSESSASAAATVPELDGGFAFIALALTAGLIALIRERKRS